LSADSLTAEHQMTLMLGATLKFNADKKVKKSADGILKRTNAETQS
jgi:hypothetical protein